jgi:phospholipid/cholesterol/gamma-HCH transport system permease protein
MITRPMFFGELVRQVYVIGIRSLWLTSSVGFCVGLVFAMQTVNHLKRIGSGSYLAAGVGLAIVSELGPVFTGIMVAARAGAGIGAEIGSMKVTRQIDALRVTAVDPMEFLVATRVLACVIVLPILTAIADVVGIFGGWIIGTTVGDIAPMDYLHTTYRYVRTVDVFPGLFKTLFFGLAIGLLACFEGFRTKGGTEGVGISTTLTVQRAALAVMICDVLLTRILSLLIRVQ